MEMNLDMSNVSTSIEAVATQLDPIDPQVANRLRTLREAIDGSAAGQVAYIDLYGAFEPAGVEERATIFFQRRPRFLSVLEWIRNVLVLVPIAWTWLGLSWASRNYEALIAQRPDLISQPFLLLWEQGFVQLGSRQGPTFSEIARWDFIVLFAIIGLTVAVHYWRDVQEERAARRAASIRHQLEQVIWVVATVFADEQHKQSQSQALLSVSEAMDHFETSAHEFLDHLAGERERLEELATRREREFGDLQIFADLLSKSGKDLIRWAQKVRDVYKPFQSTASRLADQVELLQQHQEQLLTSLDMMGGQLSTLTETARSTGQSLATASRDLGDSATRNSESTQAVSAAAREMSELAAAVLEGESSIRQALAELREAQMAITSDLTTASRGFESASKGMSEALRAVGQASAELAKVRQSNERLATSLDRMVQAGTLGAPLHPSSFWNWLLAAFVIATFVGVAVILYLTLS